MFTLRFQQFNNCRSGFPTLAPVFPSWVSALLSLDSTYTPICLSFLGGSSLPYVLLSCIALKRECNFTILSFLLFRIKWRFLISLHVLERVVTFCLFIDRVNNVYINVSDKITNGDLASSLRCLSKRNESICPYKDLFMDLHCSFIQQNPKLGIA